MRIIVLPARFLDFTGMPHVHTDNRRTITEEVVYEVNSSVIDLRRTRIEVTGNEVPLGNHYHDFDEQFNGKGGGILLTAPVGDLGNITRHVLPEDGWKVKIPAKVVHTFVLSAGAVLISRTDRHFVSEGNCNEHRGVAINTHVAKLV